MQTLPETAVDYDRLMRANLTRVFSERDPEHRIDAIRQLYAENAVLYEPKASASGHAAIDGAVAALLSSLPADFSFTAISSAIGHHGIGRIRWQAGPANGPAVITGMDIVHVMDDRIHSLYVFLEPTT